MGREAVRNITENDINVRGLLLFKLLPAYIRNTMISPVDLNEKNYSIKHRVDQAISRGFLVAN